MERTRLRPEAEERRGEEMRGEDQAPARDTYMAARGRPAN